MNGKVSLMYLSPNGPHWMWFLSLLSLLWSIYPSRSLLIFKAFFHQWIHNKARTKTNKWNCKFDFWNLTNYQKLHWTMFIWFSPLNNLEWYWCWKLIGILSSSNMPAELSLYESFHVKTKKKVKEGYFC